MSIAEIGADSCGRVPFSAMHERIRDKILGGWGRFVATHPLVTIAVCLALAVGSVYLTVTRLELRSDRSQLIGPEIPWNQQYTQYKIDFPRNDDVLVVLDAPAGDPDVNTLARQIADRLAADPRVAAADAGFDLASVSARFTLLGTTEQFQTTLGELRDARRVIAADNANAALGVLLGGLADEGRNDPGALDKLDAFLAPYLAAAGGDEVDFGFLVPTRSRWQPLASESGFGNLRYVRVSLADEGEGVNEIGTALPWVREAVRQTVVESGIRPRDWGVTGIAAIEADETTEAIRDSTAASLLAIALITLVMFIAFRGLAVPLLAALALLIGMAWAFGWLMLSVGHLQLLSVVFSVILLGLGIDFALLFVSRLELVQDEHKSLASATSRVYRRMGPGMVTGAVTTAAAFASVALTEFKGMAEMGTIAAGGILLCLIAVLSAFPAMLALTGRWKSIIRHRPGGETAHFASGRLDGVDGHPLITLAVAVAVVVGLGVLSLRVRYDPNVLNLQSDGVESVHWERRIVDEDERSAWAAVVRADATTAQGLVERLRSSPEVGDVGGMGMIYPADLDARIEALTTLRDEQVAAPAADPGSAGMLSQLAAVRAGIALRARVLPETQREIRSRLDDVSQSIRDALAASRAMAPAAREAAWHELQERFETAQVELGGWLAGALQAEPPGINDLPDVLRSFFIGDDGSWLLLAYPRSDESGSSSGRTSRPPAMRSQRSSCCCASTSAGSATPPAPWHRSRSGSSARSVSWASSACRSTSPTSSCSRSSSGSASMRACTSCTAGAPSPTAARPVSAAAPAAASP
jgi:predicted RND superfamily exporter protein